MDSYPFPSGDVVRITITVEINSRGTPQIRLVRSDLGCNVDVMPTTVASVVAQDAASLPHPDSSIAGRIDAPADSFAGLIDAWCKRMRLIEGHTKGTIDSYRTNVEGFQRFTGWARPADVTTPSIEAYILHKRDAGEWTKGTTATRETAALRSFCKFLLSRKLISENPCLEVARSKNDGDEGARASSVDEAISLVRVAWARESVLGYKKSARWLQHLLRFQAGFRDGESGKLEWKRHMFLDCEIPHIHWTRDINKNRRVMNVALHPELVELLKQHREDMRKLAKTMPARVVSNTRRRNEGPKKIRSVNPDEAKSFVFPYVSSAFESDRDRAGIPAIDDRDRQYSSHSARKYFETELEAAGVSDKMVDYLMRHKGGTDMRYFDPPLKRQLLRLSKLPALSPEVIHNLPRLKDSSLTPRRDDGHDGATCQNARPHQPTQANPRPSRTEHSGEFKASMAAGLIEFLQRGLAGEPGAAFESKDISKPAMPIAPFETDSDSDALADLLTALAVLLRKGQARGSSERIQRQGRSERAG